MENSKLLNEVLVEVTFVADTVSLQLSNMHKHHLTFGRLHKSFQTANVSVKTLFSMLSHEGRFWNQVSLCSIRHKLKCQL